MSAQELVSEALAALQRGRVSDARRCLRTALEELESPHWPTSAEIDMEDARAGVEW